MCYDSFGCLPLHVVVVVFTYDDRTGTGDGVVDKTESKLLMIVGIFYFGLGIFM